MKLSELDTVQIHVPQGAEWLEGRGTYKVYVGGGLTHAGCKYAGLEPMWAPVFSGTVGRKPLTYLLSTFSTCTGHLRDHIRGCLSEATATKDGIQPHTRKLVFGLEGTKENKAVIPTNGNTLIMMEIALAKADKEWEGKREELLALVEECLESGLNSVRIIEHLFNVKTGAKLHHTSHTGPWAAKLDNITPDGAKGSIGILLEASPKWMRMPLFHAFLVSAFRAGYMYRLATGQPGPAEVGKTRQATAKALAEFARKNPKYCQYDFRFLSCPSAEDYLLKVSNITSGKKRLVYWKAETITLTGGTHGGGPDHVYGMFSSGTLPKNEAFTQLKVGA